jgi:hypothetical protein
MDIRDLELYGSFIEELFVLEKAKVSAKVPLTLFLLKGMESLLVFKLVLFFWSASVNSDKSPMLLLT